MKNLIAELREMGGRLRPEAADALEQQATVIEQLREALLRAYGCYPPPYSKEPIAIIVREALALQPRPEVLAKVKADARREGMLAAAEICEQVIEYPPGYMGRWEGYGAVRSTRSGNDCAAAIREAAKS